MMLKHIQGGGSAGGRGNPCRGCVVGPASQTDLYLAASRGISDCLSRRPNCLVGAEMYAHITEMKKSW